MITSTISQKIAEALKAKDEVRLSTMRMLLSALNYEKIAKQHNLTDEEEIIVVGREAKKRKDAIEAYEKAGAMDRAEKEKAELEILKEYLPAEMDEGELSGLVGQVIKEMGASSLADMGKVIGAVKVKTGGRAEGGKIAEIVRQALGTSN